MDESLKALVEEHRRLKDQEPKLLSDLAAAHEENIAMKKLICNICELISDSVSISSDAITQGVDGELG